MTSRTAGDIDVSSGLADREAGTAFGIYLHVPFCARRCGYCDFNTYTASELGSATSPADWERAAGIEIDLAADALAAAGGVPPVNTVFVGGGTPSLVGAEVLSKLLYRIRSRFGLADDAEVTSECNPESTSPEFFSALREGGFTRISLGMQSTSPKVLHLLDRVHTPGRPLEAVAEAHAGGFDHVNLDVIYGTPGESDADLERTLGDVIESGVDHVSAYSLIVEQGTALARRVRSGEMPAPVDDVLAHRYTMVADTLERAGYHWYEVSNFATSEQAQCRHNMGYWRDGDWWGIGPGAHSHVAGTRWWNLKHPARYAEACDSGQFPVAGVEKLTPADRHLEKLMLGLRLAEGVSRENFTETEQQRAESFVQSGMLRYRRESDPLSGFALTDRGRLLADGVIVDILD